MQQRVYIDTSVVGGYFDKVFAADTIPFFESVRRGERIILLSKLLEDELEHAPTYVKDLLTTIPSSCVTYVESTPESDLLAEHYVSAKVVGQTSLDDCRHIATATICKADFLVSWNFKHIVNEMRIEGYNRINYEHGYSAIEILTPKKLMNYGNI